jgi:hypothetical protein
VQKILQKGRQCIKHYLASSNFDFAIQTYNIAAENKNRIFEFPGNYQI